MALRGWKKGGGNPGTFGAGKGSGLGPGAEMSQLSQSWDYSASSIPSHIGILHQILGKCQPRSWVGNYIINKIIK